MAEASATDPVQALVLGVVLLAVGAWVYRRRRRYFSVDTWERSRVLRVASLFLFVVPGLDSERRITLHPDRFRDTARLDRAARRGRTGFALTCLVGGVALLVVAAAVRFPW